MKYIDAEHLKAEIERRKAHFNKEATKYQYRHIDYANNCFGARDALRDLLSFIDSLQQELDSRSIPVLRADTTEKQNRILEIIGQDEIYCHFSLDSGKETDCGYEDYNDRVYIDGDLTFNKMAEIVDFLSKNSK